jgi:hypothetical protein
MIEKKQRVGFKSWIFAVDQILRGETTRADRVQDTDIKFPVVGVSLVVILMAVIYGFCMGVFSLIHGAETSEYSRALMQTFASMTKVPLLYALTLVVTFPSLYVFNALVGSRLQVGPVFKLLVASLAVNLAVLVSMGPILAFFSASTPNYPFIVLLNVVIFAVAGFLGLLFLLQTLNRLAKRKAGDNDFGQAIPSTTARAVPAQGADASVDVVAEFVQPSAIQSPQGHTLSRHVKAVFGCWLFLFGLVGAQMGWVLRPFVGSPGLPFQFFRSRESNFFEAVSNTIWSLFS